jgi:hypothetical protein
MSKLVQGPLDYLGYCDAITWRTGGIWFGGHQQLHPIIWCIQWPKDVTLAVVSDSNLQRTITNSNLEMAGMLLQETILEACTIGPKIQAAQTAIGSDNLLAIVWTTRMATRSMSPILYHLLKGFAMQQQTTCLAPP